MGVEFLHDGDTEKKLIDNKKHGQNIGNFLLGLTGGALVAAVLGSLPFVTPALRKICLPFVPATTRQVENVMKILKGKKGRLIDLGSGDGRIVIESSKLGISSHGVELNRWLVIYSRWRAWRQGVGANTSFFVQDLWKVDLSKYDWVVVFGVDSMMTPLEKKLETELFPGSHVIACRYSLTNWKPIDIIADGMDTVWLYKRS